MASKKLTLHVISHTRWDREGLRAFQETRLALVGLIDRLVSILATQPDYVCFTLDGQAILLEDYIEIRPEQQPIITELVRAGRLQIGPWYVLPNTFLSSPEALIRNLQHGMQIVACLDNRMSVGYLPQVYGHIGQLPQILQGFGIESAVVLSGLGETPSELWWVAPDGSRVLLISLRDGYDNAASLPGKSDSLKKALAQARDSLKQHSASSALLLMNGGDYQEAQPDTAKLMQEANKRFRGTEIVQGCLPDYLSQVLMCNGAFPHVEGELDSPQRFPTQSGTLSTRIGLKQRNHEIQTLLERWSEPFSTWVTLLDTADMPLGLGTRPQLPYRLHSPTKPIAHAWHILLQNHSSASISGATIDQVQREMEARFDQAEQIAEGIAEQNTCILAHQVNTADLPGEGRLFPIVVFNAAGSPQTDLVTVSLPLSVAVEGLEVIDDMGAVQPCEAISRVEDSESQSSGTGAICLRFIAKDVPPLGYRTYALRPARVWPEGITTDEGYVIENELLSVSVDAVDATFTLFDKQTGRSFTGLNRYTDGGDRGDIGTYCPPENDTLIDVATNTPLYVERRISLVEQSLSMLQIYRLPQTLTKDRGARLPLTAQFVPVSITTILRVRQGVPRVDVEVNIHNNGALNHRLRVHFPTGIATQYALYDGHFEIVRRAILLPSAEETVDWAEQPGLEKAQRAFVTVLGDETGLTIANRGLPEAAVFANQEHVEIALTLLRCVGWLNRNDLTNRRGGIGPHQIETPAAQCPGEYTFTYSIIPHDADPLPAWQQAWAFQTSLRAEAVGVQKGSLPLSTSLVSIDNPRFILSTVKTSTDGKGMIVRGYSVSPDTETVSLDLGYPFSRAERVRLDETPTGDIFTPDKNGRYIVEVRPAEIVTLYCTARMPPSLLGG